MALKIALAPLAERDLEDIHSFIASDNAPAADRVIIRIETAIRLLATRPHMGQVVLRPQRPGLRRISVSPYIVFYRLVSIQLDVVRVLHSSRDLHDDLFL